MKKVIIPFLYFLSCTALAQSPFWRNTNGPYAGGIIAVATDSGTFVLGADFNRAFRSTDAGENWEQITEQVPGMGSSACFAVRGNVAFSGNGGRIYRSADEGLTWNSVYSPYLFEDYLTCLCVTAEEVVLAGSYNGRVFRSTNGGNDWSETQFSLTSGPLRAMLAIGPNGVLLASGARIFYSSDGGLNWTHQNSEPVLSPLTSLAFNDQGILFAGSDGAGVYKSADTGKTCVQVTTGLGSMRVLAVHSTSSGHLFAGTVGNGLYRSTNTGEQWIRCANGLGSLVIYSLASDRTGNIFLGSTDGFYRSKDDGTTWKQVNTGLANAYTYFTGFDVRDNVYAGTSSGLFQSSDHGTSWVRNSLNSGFVYSVVFDAQGLGFAAADVGVFRTTNGGESWSRIPSFGYFNNHVMIHPTGFVFAAGDAGLFRSTDSGIVWSQVGQPLINDFVSGLASSNRYIFAGSGNGRMFRSSDLGTTWDDISSDSSNSYIFDFAIHPNSHVFASTYFGGVLRSTDNGSSWSCVGFQDTTTFFAINKDGVLFVATSVGIFRSQDEGATWIPTNSGLSNLSGRSVAFDSRGYAYVGTNAGAVYVSVQPTTSIDQTIGLLPTQYLLYQNFPNPFNPSTTINYSLPHRSHVTLAIFNTLGQQVATLVNGEVDAGYHSVEFNASNLASGVYFYRLHAGGYVDTKKLLLIR